MGQNWTLEDVVSVGIGKLQVRLRFSVSSQAPLAWQFIIQSHEFSRLYRLLFVQEGSSIGKSLHLCIYIFVEGLNGWKNAHGERIWWEWKVIHVNFRFFMYLFACRRYSMFFHSIHAVNDYQITHTDIFRFSTILDNVKPQINGSHFYYHALHALNVWHFNRSGESA